MEYVLLSLRRLAIKQGDKISFTHQVSGKKARTIRGVFDGNDTMGIRINGRYYYGSNIDSESIELERAAEPDDKNIE